MAAKYANIDRCWESMAASVYDNWSRPIEFADHPADLRIVYDSFFDTVSSVSPNRTLIVRISFFPKKIECTVDPVSETRVSISKVWDQVVDLSLIRECFRSGSSEYYEIRCNRKYK